MLKKNIVYRCSTSKCLGNAVLALVHQHWNPSWAVATAERKSIQRKLAGDLIFCMFIIIRDNLPRRLHLLFSSLSLQRVKNQYCSDTRKGRKEEAPAIKAERWEGRGREKRQTVQSSLVANMTFQQSVSFIFFCHQLKCKTKGTFSLNLLLVRNTPAPEVVMPLDLELFKIPLPRTGPVASLWQIFPAYITGCCKWLHFFIAYACVMNKDLFLDFKFVRFLFHFDRGQVMLGYSVVVS